MSDKLDPGQTQHSVRPDLGTNCLVGLSADDTSRYRFNESLNADKYTFLGLAQLFLNIIIVIVCRKYF